MDKLFIDTWGFLCLRDKREKNYNKINKTFNDLLKQKVNMITTDYILDETFTLFFKRLNVYNAHNSIDVLLRLINSDSLVIERISARRFNNTIELRKKLSDKPDISFTDLTSMVVMNELEIEHIITDDAHFQHVGFHFKLIN